MTLSVGEALMASVRIQRLEDENALLLNAMRRIVKEAKNASVNRNGGLDHYYAAPPIDRALAQIERAIAASEGRPEEALDDLAVLSARLTTALTVGGEQ